MQAGPNGSTAPLNPRWRKFTMFVLSVYIGELQSAGSARHKQDQDTQHFGHCTNGENQTVAIHQGPVPAPDSTATFHSCCVLLCTETWLNDNIPDYTVQVVQPTFYRMDRALINVGKTRGRVCVYIHDAWCQVTVVNIIHC